MFRFMFDGSAENSTTVQVPAAYDPPARAPSSAVSAAARQQQRIDDLEQQLQQLSHTAAAALDRVSELETELEKGPHTHQMSSSKSSESISSMSSGDSVSSQSDRLRKLEIALQAIHRARTELSSPHHFKYI